MDDYYTILNINKTASQDEIKSAYRKLALTSHPDRGGDPKKFSKITEAYNTLKDQDKRSQYDFTFKQSDSFDSWLNQTFYYKRMQHNQNILVEQVINFSDQFTDKHVDISYELPSGKTKDITIKIPKGIRDNQKLTFANLGDDSNPHMPPGKLIIAIRVQGDSDWKRDSGDSISSTIIVNILDLMLGASVPVTIPTGREFSVTIRKGTKPGTVLNISGYGIPNISTGIAGNVLLKIEAVMPDIHDEEIIEKLSHVRDLIYTKNT